MTRAERVEQNLAWFRSRRAPVVPPAAREAIAIQPAVERLAQATPGAGRVPVAVPAFQPSTVECTKPAVLTPEQVRLMQESLLRRGMGHPQVWPSWYPVPRGRST
jgi:hypothetical protein